MKKMLVISLAALLASFFCCENANAERLRVPFDMSRAVLGNTIPEPLSDFVIDDSGIRVMFPPQNLWRNSLGEFVGSMEEGKIVLIYDFFEDASSDSEQKRYFQCPVADYASTNPPDCQSMQDAVVASLNRWASASNQIILRRKSADDERVNIFIAWTNAFSSSGLLGNPIAKVIHNSMDANDDESENAPASDAQGFSKPFYPDSKQEFVTLLFNSSGYCWYLDDESACPPEPIRDGGKIIKTNYPISLVALHEAGHVLGFGHFTYPSVMGVSGGTDNNYLTAYDRTAVRTLYSLVIQSLDMQRLKGLHPMRFNPTFPHFPYQSNSE
jgi:hypothetical protein